MILKMKDLVELLQVPESTILRWIDQGKIPFYKIGSQYQFGQSEIGEWIINNKLKKNLNVSPKIVSLGEGATPVQLSSLVDAGGVFYQVKGTTVPEVIADCVSKMKLPKGLTPVSVKESLIERELLMPTAIGHGVAVPHPRSPIITGVENESLTICFPETLLDYGAIDGNKVHTMFIILSANSRRHLEVLSKISYLAQIPEFFELLTNRAPKKQIIEYIIGKEADWSKK